MDQIMQKFQDFLKSLEHKEEEKEEEEEKRYPAFTVLTGERTDKDGDECSMTRTNITLSTDADRDSFKTFLKGLIREDAPLDFKQGINMGGLYVTTLDKAKSYVIGLLNLWNEFDK